MEGVINGYYRTGTSIVWWILHRSNPDKIILYEPHSPGLHNEFNTFKPAPDTLNPLHGLPIYNPYFKLEIDVRVEFFKNAVPKSMYTIDDFGDAVKTVKPLENVRNLYIQSNQLHLILEPFCEYFDCGYVHIVRDPVEVLYSHADSPSKLRTKIQQLLLVHHPNAIIARWLKHGKTGKFELKYCMQTAAKLNLLNSGDLLDKFLSMYININYEVYSNLERGEIVRFEDIVLRKDFKAFERLGLKVDTKVAAILDPKKAFRAPPKLRMKVQRRILKNPDLKRKLEVLGYEGGGLPLDVR